VVVDEKRPEKRRAAAAIKRKEEKEQERREHTSVRHRHALGQVARLVDVEAPQNGGVVC
jgi:hypothetical protein